MSFTHPFLQQIDHVGIQADNPEALFAFFREELGLPVAFPYAEYPFYTSGSVVLGNIFLEIMRFGPSRAPSGPPSAQYHILGFLIRPDMLADSLTELERRDVPHSGVVPFFAPEATDENPVTLWDNVYLGGLLGENAWMRLFFAMTRQARPKPSQTRSRLLNRISLALMARAFRGGMPVLTAYYSHNDAAKRAADWEALRQREGGELGVMRVQEVVVAPPANEASREAWARLLAPQTPDAAKRYALPPGPSIRLAAQSQPGVQTMTLQVTSLARAEAFARRREMLMAVQDDGILLRLPYTNGLTLRLRERPWSSPETGK